MNIRLLVIVNGKITLYNRMKSLEGTVEEAIELAEELGGKAGYESVAYLWIANFSSLEIAENFCNDLK